MKNYYKIMGLKSTATDSEIKSTYRLLAKRFHPDVNPGNAAAAEKFAALGEAYETLSDPVKKAEYDRQLAALMQQQAAQQAAQNAQNTAYGGHNAWQQAYAGRAQGQSGYAQAQYMRQQFMQQQAQMQQWLQKINEAQHEGYTKGHDAGYTEARLRYGGEIDHLKNELDAAKSREADYAAASDRFRKRLESLQKEYEGSKKFWSEKEDRLNARIEKLVEESSKMREETDKMRKEQSGKAKKAESDTETINKLKEKLKDADAELSELKQRVTELERENSELTGKMYKKDTAITDLKLENNRLAGEKKYYEQEYTRVKDALDEKEQAIEMLNQTVAQWEDFSASLDTAEAMKSLKNSWDKQLRELKKKLKNTHYGTLGVLYIATEDEIKEAFRKLVKKYTKKAETDKEFEAKLFAVNEAAKVLTDETKRKQYNAEIGITDEEIAAFAEEKLKHEESMDKLEQEAGEQEFWAYIEELMYNAQTGDAESQNTLGEMYYSGEELERDAEQAAYWFKEAAKAKHPEAFYNLGVCFLIGDGVDKDEEKGKGFVKQAAKLGSKRAEELIKADYAIDETD